MRLPASMIVVCVLLSFPPDTGAITWNVPADVPSIQAGIDSARVADTVVVSCGTYYEHGLQMKSGIVLVSEHGVAECVTIDAQGLERAFYCVDLDDATRIQGFSVTGGLAPGVVYSDQHGAGMQCWRSSPTIANCRFRLNSAELGGAGISCYGGSSPMIVDCEFVDNSADAGGGVCCDVSSPTILRCVFMENSGLIAGGGLFCLSSSPVITSCTFLRNYSSFHGSGLACFNGGDIILAKTIIAFGLEEPAVVGDAMTTVTLTCCDVFGNEGGDWWGVIDGQNGQSGNISEDPMFCDDCPRLQECSPCLHGHGCGRMGPYGIGCPCGGGPSSSHGKTWSYLKLLYR